VQIKLKGYQDEELVVVIEPGRERSFPRVTLVPKEEFASTATPTPTYSAPTPTSTSPAETPTPTASAATPSPTLPVETPTPSSPTPTPILTSPTATPPVTGFPGERFPQTRLRILTEADVADFSYADLQYAINEMYARHGAQFMTRPDLRKQFESFIWYVPMPGMTLGRINREFSRIERQNRDLLARFRDQRRQKQGRPIEPGS
jgi:hypothetical protein